MLVGNEMLNKRTILKDKKKITQPRRCAMLNSSRKEEKRISEIETPLECVLEVQHQSLLLVC